MKLELDFDYDCTVDNMQNIKTVIGNYVIETSEFLSKGKLKNMDILTFDNKQIFHMKDGRYVLEVEDCGEVEYYYSFDLTDLI